MPRTTFALLPFIAVTLVCFSPALRPFSAVTAEETQKSETASAATETKGEVTEAAGENATDENKETYLLRYAFETGNVVHFKVTDKNKTTSRKDRIRETVSNQSDVWRHFWVVNSEETGEATLELVIDRVRLTAQFDENPPTVFDSADKTKQPDRFASILKSVGKPLNRMRVNTRGELISLQNLQGGPTADQSDPAVNFLVVFPEEPLAIGDTWKQSLSVEVPVTNRLKQDIKLLRTYKLKSVKDGVAEIGMTTIVASPVRDPAVRTRLMLQTPSGTIRFDMKTKQIVHRETGVDEVIVGAFGAGTLVEAKSTRIEEQIDAPETETAAEEKKLSQTR
ncbi:DUF6263 family protein [Rubinisphaera brasiliensis]|uniref:Signal peptide-domain containing protein n=1 Tax=Rubinisphaera brasiliensis (strain ATCC 49424 / DSM 5305 / JCM 21570 / IAM 15109 / NBRC 103401 / IFAM 1448) TaxID=756272 RepID=F0SGL8_RUBBR|nr:DUF6263 family protein [Rubinisphaera brasiliensis]ADY61623.1 hypothetical protein Plabr_4046 [Rubinisphaera brasiliensis DSM 5305]